MDIEKIREMCRDESIEMTSHCLLRLQQRNIRFAEIKEAVRNGEIIEEYPNDYPYPSCLILGYTNDKKVLHIVVGLGETKLWLITVYKPDINQWSSDYKSRKE